MKRYDAGDFQGALIELEHAKKFIHTRDMLFALGTSYEKLKRPLEAYRNYSALLGSDPSLLGTPNPEHVGLAKEACKRMEDQIGYLEITSNVEDAQVEIDGLTAPGLTPLKAAIPLAKGEHVVSLVKSGYRIERRKVFVAGTTPETFALAPDTSPQVRLRVRTVLPDVDILMDGHPLARSPVDHPLVIPAGKHEFLLQRPGYKALPVDNLDTSVGAQPTLDVDLEEDRSAAVAMGTLSFEIEPSGAELSVDGRRYGVYRGQPLALSEGRHVVGIVRGGYAAVTENIVVTPSGQPPIRIHLLMTPEERARLTEIAQSRRLWGVVAAVAGVALGGAGTGLFLHYDGAQDDAARQLASTRASFTLGAGGRCDYRMEVDHGACESDLARAEARLDETTVWRGVAIGTMVVGGILAVAGGAVALLARDPKDDTSDTPSKSFYITASPPLGPQTSVGLAMGGRF